MTESVGLSCRRVDCDKALVKTKPLIQLVDPAVLCADTQNGQIPLLLYFYGNDIPSLLSTLITQPRQCLIIMTRVSSTTQSYCPRAPPPHTPQTLRQSRNFAFSYQPTILVAHTSPPKRANQVPYHPDGSDLLKPEQQFISTAVGTQ